MFEQRSSAGHDAQACFEEALLRTPREAYSQRAANQLEQACRAGDAGGCSALGLLSELGLGRPQSVVTARGLYARACEGGNARGCVSLGKLELASDPSTHGQRVSRVFADACDGGEASGCAALGQLHLRGEVVARNPPEASRLFGKACSKGSVVACYELGELERTAEAPVATRLVELYVKACVGGHQPACARLDSRAQSKLPTRIASR